MFVLINAVAVCIFLSSQLNTIKLSNAFAVFDLRCPANRAARQFAKVIQKACSSNSLLRGTSSVRGVQLFHPLIEASVMKYVLVENGQCA